MGRLIRALVSASVVGLTAPAAFAEEAERAREAAEADEGDEIVVVGTRLRTATKTDTDVMEIPQAISIVPGELMEQQAATSLAEALRNVAGVVQSDASSGGAAFFSMRGFFADSDGGFRRNGIELPKATDLLNPNAERIEVLKGPSSILYGRLDPGGVINIVTEQPEARPFREIELRGGSNAYVEGRFDITGPFTDAWAYRLNAAHETRDSFRDVVHYESSFLSPVIAFEPSEGTRWAIEAELKEERVTEDPGLRSTSTSFAAVDAIPIDLFYGDDEQVSEREHVVLTSTLDHEINPTLRLRNVLSSAAHDWRPETVVISGLQSDGRTLNRFAYNGDQSHDFASAELGLDADLTTGPVSHRFYAGLDYQRTEFETTWYFATLPSIDLFEPRDTGSPGLEDLDARADTATDLYGAFLQDQMTIGRRFHVQLALRYATFDQTARNLIFFPAESGTETELDAAEWVPRIGVVYAPSESLSFYGSYSQSFAPTTFVSPTGQIFKPSYGEQYEIGVKRGLFSNRLFASLAIYQLTRTNVLSFFRDSSGVFRREQGGVHRSEGVELELIGSPAPGWTLAASYGWMDARVLEDRQHPTGRSLGGAPENQASLWLAYQHPSGLGAGAGAFYVDEMRPYLSSNFFLPSRTTFDAMVSYRISPHTMLRLVAKNMTDERYYVGGAPDGAFPGAPSAFELALSYVF